MKRDLKALGEWVSDLLVVGGGIYGAAIARDAALRGLRVALVDRQDFGAATSANSHKIIHGGLRYLQHLDFARLRESLHERCTLERIAPHLVHPLPVVVPTFGHGLRGKELLSIGVRLHGLFRLTTRDALPGVVEGLPPGAISRRELVALLPALDSSAATGGVVFYDSQVHSSERLLFGYLRSAADAGAILANYVEAAELLREGGRVTGILARDAIDGNRLEVRARAVVNAAGPWIGAVLGSAGVKWREGHAVQAINVATRQLFPRVAAGLYGRASHHDSDAFLARGQRLYFLVPWRDRTIIGTVYATHDGDPSRATVASASVEELLAEVNFAYPAANLTLDDVSLVYSGLLPSAGVSRRTGEVQVSKHYRIQDHSGEGLPGLYSVEGVKYTTARDVAERFVDRLFATWGKTAPASRSAEHVLAGGAVGRLTEYLRAERLRRPDLPPAGMERLVRTYGSAYGEVLRTLGAPVDGIHPATDENAVLRAECLHAVREEMALTLADVALRRTEVGSASHPGRAVLETMAGVLAGELGWTRERIEQEIESVEARYGVPR